MPDFVGFTMARVESLLQGNPRTTEGLYRHYQIVPPPDSNVPWVLSGRVGSQSPAAGTCSQTSLNSTLYLALP